MLALLRRFLTKSPSTATGAPIVIRTADTAKEQYNTEDFGFAQKRNPFTTKGDDSLVINPIVKDIKADIAKELFESLTNYSYLAKSTIPARDGSKQATYESTGNGLKDKAREDLINLASKITLEQVKEDKLRLIAFRATQAAFKKQQLDILFEATTLDRVELTTDTKLRLIKVLSYIMNGIDEARMNKFKEAAAQRAIEAEIRTEEFNYLQGGVIEGEELRIDTYFKQHPMKQEELVLSRLTTPRVKQVFRSIYNTAKGATDVKNELEMTLHNIALPKYSFHYKKEADILTGMKKLDIVPNGKYLIIATKEGTATKILTKIFLVNDAEYNKLQVKRELNLSLAHVLKGANNKTPIATTRKGKKVYAILKEIKKVVDRTSMDSYDRSEKQVAQIQEQRAMTKKKGFVFTPKDELNLAKQEIVAPVTPIKKKGKNGKMKVVGYQTVNYETVSINDIEYILLGEREGQLVVMRNGSTEREFFDHSDIDFGKAEQLELVQIDPARKR